MVTTQAGIVKDALQLSGSQTQVTGSLPNFDGSPTGLAAGVLYSPALQLLLREMDPDFARKIASLVPPDGQVPCGGGDSVCFVEPAIERTT
jgi:hypothetical protein